MKSKRTTKTKIKGSLQKTASTVINMHTQRNSVINETLPFYNNDSMLSIRTSSLLNNKNNDGSLQRKDAKFSSENKLRKKKLILQEVSKNQSQDKKNLNQIQTKTKQSKFAKQSKGDRRSQICSEKKKISKNSLAFTESMFCNVQAKPSKNLNLNQIFLKNKQILDHYRSYIDQLIIDRNKYKQRYKEAILKLKKYEHKESSKFS